MMTSTFLKTFLTACVSLSVMSFSVDAGKHSGAGEGAMEASPEKRVGKGRGLEEADVVSPSKRRQSRRLSGMPAFAMDDSPSGPKVAPLTAALMAQHNGISPRGKHRSGHRSHHDDAASQHSAALSARTTQTALGAMSHEELLAKYLATKEMGEKIIDSWKQKCEKQKAKIEELKAHHSQLSADNTRLAGELEESREEVDKVRKGFARTNTAMIQGQAQATLAPVERALRALDGKKPNVAEAVGLLKELQETLKQTVA